MKNKKLKTATSIMSLAILITPISTLTNNSNIANAKTKIQNKNIKENNIDKTIDILKNKYGFSSVKRASELKK